MEKETANVLEMATPLRLRQPCSNTTKASCQFSGYCRGLNTVDVRKFLQQQGSEKKENQHKSSQDPYASLFGVYHNYQCFSPILLLWLEQGLDVGRPKSCPDHPFYL